MAALAPDSTPQAHGEDLPGNRRRDVEERLGKYAFRCSESYRKELVTEEPATFVEDSLEDIPHLSYHTAQRGICSVMYKVMEQVMFGLFREERIREILNSHMARLFDPEAAADRL